MGRACIPSEPFSIGKHIFNHLLLLYFSSLITTSRFVLFSKQHREHIIYTFRILFCQSLDPAQNTKLFIVIIMSDLSFDLITTAFRLSMPKQKRRTRTPNHRHRIHFQRMEMSFNSNEFTVQTCLSALLNHHRNASVQSLS